MLPGTMTDQRIEDPYRVLGVPRGSTDAAIAAAHRALARQHHPDIAGDASTERMTRINAAFDAIRTAERRLALDGEEAAAAPKKPTPTGADRLRRRPSNDGTGGAGPPPGRPSGSVLDFGRHVGWSIGEIARVDPGYLGWLSDRPEGRPYLDEIDAVLRRAGLRTDAAGGDRGRSRFARRR